MQKKIYYMILVVWLSFLGAAGVNLIFFNPSHNALDKKLSFLTLPKLLQHKNQYREQFNDYMKSDFYLKLKAVALVNQLNLTLSQVTGGVLITNKVVVGKNNYFFYNHDFDRIREYKCNKRLSESDFPDINNKLLDWSNTKQIAQFVGIDLHFSISPDKSVILNNQLSDKMECYKQHKADYSYFRRKISGQYDVKEYFDLVKDIEKQHGTEYDIYYKGDTHWTPIVYKEVFRDLASEIYNISLSEMPMIGLKPIKEKVGDLYRMLRLKRKDKDYVFEEKLFKEFIQSKTLPQKTFIYHDSFFGMFLTARTTKDYFQSENLEMRRIGKLSKKDAVDFLKEFEPKMIIFNSVERHWEARIDHFKKRGDIYEYILDQHHKKGKACALNAKELMPLKFEYKNIQKNAVGHTPITDVPQMIMAVPKIGHDICISIEILSSAKTNLEIFYSDSPRFIQSKSWSYDLKAGHNQIYFMVPKEFSEKYLRIDPVKGKIDYAIEVQAHKNEPQ